MQSKTVRSIMREPVVASINDAVLSVAEQMVTHKIGAVIVVKEYSPVGIITERDIIEKVVKPNKNPKKVSAKDIMSSPLISIEPDRTIADALKLMRDKGIRRLAVISSPLRALIGIVTERRLLDALV